MGAGVKSGGENMGNRWVFTVGGEGGQRINLFEE